MQSQCISPSCPKDQPPTGAASHIWNLVLTEERVPYLTSALREEAPLVPAAELFIINLPTVCVRERKDDAMNINCIEEVDKASGS